jgi:hypothetical protein
VTTYDAVDAFAAFVANDAVRAYDADVTVPDTPEPRIYDAVTTYDAVDAFAAFVANEDVREYDELTVGDPGAYDADTAFVANDELREFEELSAYEELTVYDDVFA